MTENTAEDPRATDGAHIDPATEGAAPAPAVDEPADTPAGDAVEAPVTDDGPEDDDD